MKDACNSSNWEAEMGFPGQASCLDRQIPSALASETEAEWRAIKEVTQRQPLASTHE